MSSIFFLYYFFLFLFAICFYLFISNKKFGKCGFRNYPVVGILPEFIENRHRIHEWITDTLIRCPTNTGIIYRPGLPNGVFTANPGNVEHILKTKFENYPKGDRFITLLGDFLGRGIFNSDGDLWRHQRKIASHEFSTKSLRNFVVENVTSEISARLVPILTRAAKVEEVLDLQDILERFAFDNICKVAFNVDPSCLGGDGSFGSEFKRAFEEAAALSTDRFTFVNAYLWRIKKSFNVGSEQALKKSVAAVHEFANNIIRSRLEGKTEKTDNDLLSRFIRSDQEKSPKFLRDIVISFILAGRDTTSSGLSWFFWLLSLNRRVEGNILKELEQIRSRNGKRVGDTYSFDELKDMHYLHAAISESLRLYPPVPIDTKACLKDDVLPDGTVIRKGWFIAYHAFAMGRMESIWGENCNEYLPERWLENGIFRQENEFRFPVFNAGPRICLGKDMAYIQMKSIVASVIERFIVEVHNKEKSPEYGLSLTLRMKNGLHVKVKERSGDITS